MANWRTKVRTEWPEKSLIPGTRVEWRWLIAKMWWWPLLLLHFKDFQFPFLFVQKGENWEGNCPGAFPPNGVIFYGKANDSGTTSTKPFTMASHLVHNMNFAPIPNCWQQLAINWAVSPFIPLKFNSFLTLEAHRMMVRWWEKFGNPSRPISLNNVACFSSFLYGHNPSNQLTENQKQLIKANYFRQEIGTRWLLSGNFLDNGQSER